MWGKIKKLFNNNDIEVSENEDGGKSYEVTVKSGVKEVSSENG